MFCVCYCTCTYNVHSTVKGREREEKGFFLNAAWHDWGNYMVDMEKDNIKRRRRHVLET